MTNQLSVLGYGVLLLYCWLGSRAMTLAIGCSTVCHDLSAQCVGLCCVAAILLAGF